MAASPKQLELFRDGYTRIEANSEQKHSVFQFGAGRDFVVFNDQELSMDAVTDEDIDLCEIEAGSHFASAAWSCNCSWFFIITEDSILLFNTYSTKGFRCRKKSAAFIEAFLDAPYSLKRQNSKRQTKSGSPLAL
jgi:hypothetical protein